MKRFALAAALVLAACTSGVGPSTVPPAAHGLLGSQPANVTAVDVPLGGATWSVPAGAKIAPNAVAPPAAIVVVPSIPNQDLNGDQTNGFDLAGAYKANGTTKFVRYFSAVAVDANGNFLVGTGSPKITMTSLTPTMLSNGVAAAKNPNKFAITPAGGGIFPQLGRMKVTAKPATGKTITTSFSLRINFANAPRIYEMFLAQNKVSVFDEYGHAVSLPGSFAGLDDPISMFYDSHNHSIYVINGIPSQIMRFNENGALVSTNSVVSGATVGTYNPGNGFIYVAQILAPVKAYAENYSQITTLTGSWKLQATNGYSGFTYGFVPDSRTGQLYLLDSTNDTVQVFDATGNAVFDWAPLKRGSDLLGIAIDPISGRVFVSDDSTGLQVFDEFGDTVVTAGGFSGLQEATYIAWDSTNRRIYVEDAGAGKIKAFDTNGFAVSTPGGFPNSASAAYLTIAP